MLFVLNLITTGCILIQTTLIEKFILEFALYPTLTLPLTLKLCKNNNNYKKNNPK